jgi:hypothetical protein
MPHDFPTAFGPCKTKKGGVEEPQTALIIADVVNMALGSEVEEHRHQRNRAMLASWGVLTREQDELRTMTWADFGFRFNIEPFWTEAVSTWVTLPGGAADYWVNEKEMDMSKALDSLEVWNTAGAKGGNVLVLPKFIQRRNFKGLDGLRITYGDSRRMAKKADPDGTVKLSSEPATLTTFWANDTTAPKKDEGQKRSPQALPTEESSGEDSEEKAERKRKRKKEAPGEAVRPVPFLSLGRMVPGPGEEYGEEDYVLLPDVFGDMGKKKNKQPPKLSLPSHEEAEPPSKEKAGKELVLFKKGGPDHEEMGKGFNKPVEKQKRWADVMEEDKAEAARARAELEEEKRKWRARLHEDEVLSLDAPSGKTVMELLAEKEAQGKQAEQPKAGTKPLEGGFIKTTPASEVHPSLNTGEKGASARDEAMGMALRIKDPKVQAGVARALNTTRLGTTRSRDSDSTTDKEEEEQVSADERARKKAEKAKKKIKKAKAIERADSQTSGKLLDKKIKRSKGMEEVEEGETEKAPELVLDLEMTDVQDPLDEQREREPLKKETEIERAKRKRTEQEGRKVVQESVEKVLKGTASARAENETLKVHEGQEPEPEPESQDLTEQLKVRARTGELKDLLYQAAGSCGNASTATQQPQKRDQEPSVERSLNPSGDPVSNPPSLELPVAPPPVPVEMKDVHVQAGAGTFQGRETWDVIFLPMGYVRVDKLIMNSQGQFEEPSEATMSVEKFFKTKSTWPPYIRAFRFQDEALPPLLGKGIDRIF